MVAQPSCESDNMSSRKIEVTSILVWQVPTADVFQTFYEGSQEPQIPKFTELQTVADVYQGHGPSLELNGEPDQNDSFDDTETQPSQSTSTNMDRSLVCDTITDEKHLVDEDN